MKSKLRKSQLCTRWAKVSELNRITSFHSHHNSRHKNRNRTVICYPGLGLHTREGEVIARFSTCGTDADIYYTATASSDNCDNKSHFELMLLGWI